MKKTIYLIRGSKTESYAAFKQRMIVLANNLVKQHDLKELKVVLTESPPPAISIIPFKKKKVAVISLSYEKSIQDTEIRQAEGYTGTFVVTEALPVAYAKTWKDGEATPGICLLTLFNQKKDIDYGTFIDRWHNSHTPLSLKLHPLWHYNRNVVDKRASDNLENWDGIVEEHFKTRAELLNPFKFFGNPIHIIPNMIAVYRDTNSFLDYITIEPYLATEYYLKSKNFKD
jgi:hypothetical protein